VVQAVAGSSPVAHPDTVAAQDVFLRQRCFRSDLGELPMGYQMCDESSGQRLAQFGSRIAASPARSRGTSGVDAAESNVEVRRFIPPHETMS
jgi:hypothetical protein